MFRNLCLLLCAFSTSEFVFAQAIIVGNAPHHKEEYVVLYQLTDAISNQRSFIDKKLINAKGEFEFTVNNAATTPYYLSIGAYSGLLFVEPNAQYFIEIPAPDKKSYQRLEGSELIFILKNSNEKELNVAIRQFNQMYFEFINEHYYDFAAGAYVGNDQLKEKIKVGAGDPTPKDTSANYQREPSNFPLIVDLFRADVDSIFSEVKKNEFFDDYVSYSISEIELLAGLNRKIYYETYFMSRLLPYLNPAFGSAFKLFYKNTFVELDKDVQMKIVKAVNLEHDSKLMIEAFSNDSITKSSEIKALVCLNILREAKTNGLLLDPAVISTLEDFGRSSKEEIKGLAQQIILQKTQFKAGWKLEDFTLIDGKGNKWIWSQQESKATYLFFFATWSSSSLKELALLNKLHMEFGDYIQFIAINMDADIELMKKYLAEHRDQKVPVLSGLADPMLGVKTNMKSIPHALWLDEFGRYFVNYSRKPSEGLEMDLKKYLALLKTNNKSGQKTWKGQ